MPRKNNKDWTSVAIKKAILKKLDKLKIHQNQSYSEVIENLLKSCSTKQKLIGSSMKLTEECVICDPASYKEEKKK